MINCKQIELSDLIYMEDPLDSKYGWEGGLFLALVCLHLFC